MPGCTEVTSSSRCATHTAQRERVRGTSTQRGYDADWQRVRKVVLGRDDYRCRLRLTGCTFIATTVDHIVPLSAGGSRLDRDNLQSACHHCNMVKGTRRMGDLW